ncbi:hypothetical protein BN136_2329 [Cronobacter universalis NCTC 9529]|nr:hypothetical protein BN136_2329 [Cronobacter universalis NCTC 9529]
MQKPSRAQPLTRNCPRLIIHRIHTSQHPSLAKPGVGYYL